MSVFRHYVIYAEDDPSAAAMHYREDSFSLPPNVADGREHLKLLDYRHHKKRNQAHSVVGTGNYMAPEVILKTGTLLSSSGCRSWLSTQAAFFRPYAALRLVVRRGDLLRNGLRTTTVPFAER